ncbi:hypothetical protein RMR16_025015 (plasmid) [Agrobacterium sp. rho-13.3]|uniref:hypothetical protein n=1 Tax=Agrobacterium sp. rho-13.3 TaxID=3072980 RepID=UPI002A0E0E62|nr:hypothetical protein [Agrobacterium sp. rho-13.3]MDX8310213.1 hypothetical protein [Agrobacterium sp. rho-13.3]
MSKLFVLPLVSSLLVGSGASSTIAQPTSDPSYLEKRNDLGLVAYCTSKGLLPPDSEQFFKAGIDGIYGDLPSNLEADYHENRGRDGIVHLQGEEQSIDDLATENDVAVSEVCNQYKQQITLGKIMARNASGAEQNVDKKVSIRHQLETMREGSKSLYLARDRVGLEEVETLLEAIARNYDHTIACRLTATAMARQIKSYVKALDAKDSDMKKLVEGGVKITEISIKQNLENCE